MSTTDMPTALVVGASRGIGSALAKQLKQDGYDVIATARKPDGLSLGEGIEIIQLDTTDDESVKKAAGQIESLVSFHLDFLDLSSLEYKRTS